jgi:tetratricopeptide (TPR) repeat protein/glycosyltransferase involved in cell wall biosynthesis
MTSLAELLAVAGQCLQARDYGQAEQACRQVLQTDASQADAWYLLGAVRQAADDLVEAEKSFREAIRLRPDFPRACNSLGILLARQGRRAEAEVHFAQAVRFQPDFAQAHNNLGNVRKEQNRPAEAADSYREALRLQPHFADAHNNLAEALRVLGQLADAERHCREALRLRPSYPEAHNHLGNIQRDGADPEAAAASYREALRLQPNFPMAQNNLGSAYTDQGRIKEALACFEEAIRLDPNLADAHHHRALAWLQMGDYQRGWVEHEWRWRRATAERRSFPQPIWDGSPLEGRTILLWAEQGLGDTLQFVRYAPLVKARGGVVVLECQPPLARLLAGCPGVDRVLPRGTPPPPFDVQIPLMSLPRVFGTTLDTVPCNVPYLRPDPALVKHWGRELAAYPGFKVGVAWHGSGNQGYQGVRNRSFPLTCLASLAAVPNVRLISLQKGPGSEQIQAIAGSFPVTELKDLDETSGSFMDTAAVMEGLDLVVCADTSVAHLAGALGARVWLALPFRTDWRWPSDQEDSPWYPTMRLFRQPEAGRWDPVFRRMAEELRPLAGPRPVAPAARLHEPAWTPAVSWPTEPEPARAAASTRSLQSFSVVVTAHNMATVLERTLQSVEDSIAFFHKELGESGKPAGEIVVVDDGSTDGTGAVLEKFAAGKSFYKVVHRPEASSPSCARNTGAAESGGELLFFLDGDDLFLPPHIHTCYRALADGWDYVKTRVRLAHPVHPAWKKRIEISLAINLCVPRVHHFAVGGFPDFHLVVRGDKGFWHVMDIFYKLEDSFYNRLLYSLFRGGQVERETVEYIRSSGNEYDRQYEKFRKPYEEQSDKDPPDRRIRVQLGGLIAEYLVEELRRRGPAGTAGPGGEAIQLDGPENVRSPGG